MSKLQTIFFLSLVPGPHSLSFLRYGTGIYAPFLYLYYDTSNIPPLKKY